MIAAGVMSGTSCDGIDVVVLDVDPEIAGEPRVVAHGHTPYPEAVRTGLLDPRALRIDRVSELHFELAELYANAVRALGVQNLEVCGLHGQTLWHDPPSRAGGRTPSTLQIGSSAVVAHRLGVPVVGDLRGADIAEGGEGAPIVPFSHWFFTPEASRPRLIVNIGGIANASVVACSLDEVIGYDLGPGMMLADALAALASDGAMKCDEDGALSRLGTVDAKIVTRITEHPYARASAPKSTGRELFGAAFLEEIVGATPAHAHFDRLASVIEATATLIARAAIAHGLASSEIVLTGGGAKNPTLVSAVARLAPHARVSVVDRGVFLPDHHEPAAMALYGARTLRGLPSSLPRVTGARRASVLGHVHWP